MRYFVAVMGLLGAAVGGCEPALRGDGSIGVIRVSSGIGALMPVYGDDSITMLDLACEAARMWDASGARLRCERDLGNLIASNSVNIDSANPGELSPGDADAWYDGGLSLIRVPTPLKMIDETGGGWWRATLAHELGHALGLGHLQSGTLMSPMADSPTLTPADIAACRARWQ